MLGVSRNAPSQAFGALRNAFTPYKYLDFYALAQATPTEIKDHSYMFQYAWVKAKTLLSKLIF